MCCSEPALGLRRHRSTTGVAEKRIAIETGGFEVARNFNKRNLTTGDIAALCGVNFRTVIRWIQRGHLKAYQLPGRGDNRVQVADFIDFLNENDMPIPEELQPSPKKVLIVEGDPKTGQNLDEVLQKAGYETRLATDGFTAGALARSFNPSVMTVNVGMKGIDGAQAIKLMRDDPGLGQTKVIAVNAASTSKKKRAELETAGADEIVDRPVTGDDLVEKIGSFES
ncbi:MAG: response regulator [Thermoanaerobaculales bacterium]|jgi:excisionase family DNA binding protein|nr:response regulator [Thermoanaerobaculales bacterium]